MRQLWPTAGTGECEQRCIVYAGRAALLLLIMRPALAVVINVAARVWNCGDDIIVWKAWSSCRCRCCGRCRADENEVCVGVVVVVVVVVEVAMLLLLLQVSNVVRVKIDVRWHFVNVVLVVVVMVDVAEISTMHCCASDITGNIMFVYLGWHHLRKLAGGSI